jgi:hypothetical protein
MRAVKRKIKDGISLHAVLKQMLNCKEEFQVFREVQEQETEKLV